MRRIRPILLIALFIFISNLHSQTEVGGHLSEDTIWNPEDSPYLVTEILYVDPGVTLTILPGVEVKVSSAPCTNWQERTQNFWLYNGVSVAKMIRVNGRIIAEGTKQDSIVFTRLQDDPDYYWGNIYITEQADMSRFEHCKFEYTAGIGIALGHVAYGALSILNGKVVVKNSFFQNNASMISTYFGFTKEIEIINNKFASGNGLNNFVLGIGGTDLSITSPMEGYKPALIANNVFEGSNIGVRAYYVNNHHVDSFVNTGSSQWNASSYFYDNHFIDCYRAIHSWTRLASIYIRNNNFIGGTDGVDIDHAYVEISDNYFEGCDIVTMYVSGKVFNNKIEGGEARIPGEIEVYNNISFNNDNGYGLEVGYNPYCANNISVNNQYAIWGKTMYYDNCIILNNDELTQHYVSGNPIFRNSIVDFPIEPPLIDGGGNIIVDSLQAQEIFEDIQGGNFHLAEGSIAIDAGFDTLSYYYSPFDMEYNHRVWDGSGDGNAVIDIGAYEYGAPSLGEIAGYVYDPVTGETVDYVFIKIDNQPGEFTFADSDGSFTYRLPAGVYDVYAERVFYDDVIEYNVEVIDGETTELIIPMSKTVDAEDNEVSAIADFNIMNYPNPFNPETTIKFDLMEAGEVELTIYNIKGQKVKQLLGEHLPAGEHKIVWDGKDYFGNSASSGVYVYKLKLNGEIEAVQKCLLLK